MENFAGDDRKRNPTKMEKSEVLTSSKRGQKDQKWKRCFEWHDRLPQSRLSGMVSLNKSSSDRLGTTQGSNRSEGVGCHG
jgi:hypothetical protein